MKCWHCNSEMIWGNDFDYGDYGIDEEGIVSEFSCSNCNCTATFYCPIDNIAQQPLSGSPEGSPKSCRSCKKCPTCNGDMVEEDEAGLYICWESA